MRLTGAMTRFGATLAALAATLASTACSGGGRLRVESRDAVIEPALATAVYKSSDPNTADIFLSDFEPEVLEERLALGAEGPPGNLVHIHLFIDPRAGRTPIDFTATSATVRHVVFSGAAIGVYGGGGFLLPRGGIGGPSLTGRIENASLKLVSADPGFADRLGLAELSGRVAATRDEEFSARISTALTRLLSRR